LLLLIALFTMADTLTVKQDGTGDYTVIQTAINNSVNGDTIVVYPGVYIENIDLMGKTLMLSSTYLYNPADSIVWQTMIDGDSAGSCILANKGEQDLVIKGFTIKNGSGFNEWEKYYSGGGIFIEEGTASIQNCIIQNNFACFGGGIAVSSSIVNLSGNIIRNNHATNVGGGIMVASNTSAQIIFDTINLNTVYLNYAAVGNDYHQNWVVPYTTIKLDTATVVEPDHYFFSAINPNGFQTGNLEVEAMYGITTAVNSDLYISPDGDNSNTGQTPENPLKSFSFALLKVKPDSTKYNTIHLAEGTYSASTTGERMPVNLKSYIMIRGSDRENTIIDAEKSGEIFNQGLFALFNPGETEMKIKNLSFINAKSAYKYNDPVLHCRNNNYVEFDSIIFHENSSLKNSSIGIGDNDSVVIKNCIFYNNVGTTDFIFWNYPDYKGKLFMSSCEFYNNGPNPEGESHHIPLYFNGADSPHPINIFPIVINTLFHNNYSNYNGGWPHWVAAGMASTAEATFVNCTFADNIEENGTSGAALGMARDNHVKIYNSVFWGNRPYQIVSNNTSEDHPNTIEVYNSCIEDGYDGIKQLSPYNNIVYDETNIMDNPDFFGQGDFPYMLGSGSPCIDAGTLDLPEGVELPEFDLAGNPRIYGETVDMGAYEWSPVNIGEYQPIEKQKEKLLEAAPNPFDWGTYVTAKYKHDGNITVVVFNNYGRFVKVLLDVQNLSGRSEMQWTGDDDNNNPLPKGIYHIVMYFDDVEVEAIKVLKQ